MGVSEALLFRGHFSLGIILAVFSLLEGRWWAPLQPTSDVGFRGTAFGDIGFEDYRLLSLREGLVGTATAHVTTTFPVGCFLTS